ncbi:hypothetical protein RF11_10176 [Thelohanellus kitauei]|uniref:Tc1-like transposase DDE domain-containing protein n=1 Tax=Thelohanellus kitauei TaxID=669202 RepID=A0A0C2MUF7_THEKT|nr:hypothetical protein RF11_10176 [Thelohanellus kitauei]
MSVIQCEDSFLNSYMKTTTQRKFTASSRGGARNMILTQKISDRITKLMNDDLTTNLREIKQQLGVVVTKIPYLTGYKTRDSRIDWWVQYRNHGWSRRERTPNLIMSPRSANIAMRSSMNRHNSVNSDAIRGSVNNEVLNAFLTVTMNVLGEAEGFIFVLNNVNYHHAVTALGTSNISIHYLLPYSPVFNPCEGAFALIKSNVR